MSRIKRNNNTYDDDEDDDDYTRTRYDSDDMSKRSNVRFTKESQGNRKTYQKSDDDDDANHNTSHRYNKDDDDDDDDDDESTKISYSNKNSSSYSYKGSNSKDKTPQPKSLSSSNHNGYGKSQNGYNTRGKTQLNSSDNDNDSDKDALINEYNKSYKLASLDDETTNYKKSSFSSASSKHSDDLPNYRKSSDKGSDDTKLYKKSALSPDDLLSNKKSVSPNLSNRSSFSDKGKYDDSTALTSRKFSDDFTSSKKLSGKTSDDLSSYKKSTLSSNDLPSYTKSASPNLSSRTATFGKDRYDDLEDRDKLSALNSRNIGSRSPIPPSYEPMLSANAQSRVSSSSLYRSFNDYSATKPATMSRGGTLDEMSLKTTGSHVSLSTIDVKQRSYLCGSSSKNSMLGESELERVFPDRKLKVFVGTWNLCGIRDIPASLSSFVLPDAVEQLCDIYAIGTQESGPNRREWDLQLQEVLGPHFVLFHSATFGVLNLSIFLRRDLIWFCSVSEEDSVATRAASAFKTKGGLGVCFTVFGTSLLFINCHFSPHDGAAEQRIADYKKIRAELVLPKANITYQHQFINGDVTKGFDSTFWFGDTNFRLVATGGRANVDEIIKGIEQKKSETFEKLVNLDELRKAQNEETAFEDFAEGRIKFKPTYKYDIGTDNFDSSEKMRVPGYTDRILYKSKRKGGIQCLDYNSVMEVRSSDHKPVYGIFSVALRPGLDRMPLCGGQYDREAWLIGIERRKQQQPQSNPATVKTPGSKTCSLQ